MDFVLLSLGLIILIIALLIRLQGRNSGNFFYITPKLFYFSLLLLFFAIISKFSSDYVFCIILFASGLIGIFFQKTQDSDSLKKTIMSILFFYLIIHGTVILGYKSFFPEKYHEEQYKDEIFYSKAAGFVLGQHLAQKFKDKNVLIIGSSDSDIKLNKACLEGLLEGLDKSVNILAVDFLESVYNEDKAIKIKSSPERILHLKRNAKADAINSIISRYCNINLIISLVGLPKNPEDMHIWQYEPEKIPSLALLKTDLFPYIDAIKAGYICAAVCSKPVFDKVKIKNYGEAFEARFLLVTPDNISVLQNKYPEAFAEKTAFH